MKKSLLPNSESSKQKSLKKKSHIYILIINHIGKQKK